MSDINNSKLTKELNEAELKKVSGGGRFPKGEPSHKVGEKFTTDYYNSAESREYGVIIEVMGYIDDWYGYQYKYATYYQKDNSFANYVGTTYDVDIATGGALMENYRIYR